MKNREKYKNELMDVIKKDGNICGFVINHGVSRMFGKDMESFCGEMDCPSCTTALQLWLDEEYEEPPKPKVDWNKVSVDTLVRVRNSEDDKWLLRYFHLYCEDAVALKYKTFDFGTTSKTCIYPDENWRYCELVEDGGKWQENF